MHFKKWKFHNGEEWVGICNYNRQIRSIFWYFTQKHHFCFWWHLTGFLLLLFVPIPPPMLLSLNTKHQKNSNHHLLSALKLDTSFKAFVTGTPILCWQLLGLVNSLPAPGFKTLKIFLRIYQLSHKNLACITRRS